MRCAPGIATTLACLFTFSVPTFAHGDDQMLIDSLTEELAKAPEADLYIRRGELFRHHQEWSKAAADYEAAARLDPQLTIVDYFRARLRLEAGEPSAALPLVERYLQSAPNEAEAWFLHGDVLAALNRHDDGALDYTEGIRRANRPLPEHFLRRAKFLALAPEPKPQRILAALDEGIERLGPVIALIDFAIKLELEQKNYDGALQRIDLAMQHAPRRETWLVRRADIFAQAGRVGEAIAAYQAALAAIEELPVRYRETVPMEKLARDARAALETLAAKTAAPEVSAPGKPRS